MLKVEKSLLPSPNGLRRCFNVNWNERWVGEGGVKVLVRTAPIIYRSHFRNEEH